MGASNFSPQHVSGFYQALSLHSFEIKTQAQELDFFTTKSLTF